MKRFAYARFDQKKTDSYENSLNFLRYIDIDSVFSDDFSSFPASRNYLLEHAQKGDSIIIQNFRTVSPNASDFRWLISRLSAKEIDLISIDEDFTLSSHRGRLMLQNDLDEYFRNTLVTPSIYFRRRSSKIIQQESPAVSEQKTSAPEPSVNLPENTNPPLKRGRGRPRKNPLPAAEPVKTETVVIESPVSQSETAVPVPAVKRGRGRPRKNPLPAAEPAETETVITESSVSQSETGVPVPAVKRGRGRPRKNPLPAAEPVETETAVTESPVSQSETAAAVPAVKRGRGRPPGSKNKKTAVITDPVKQQVTQEDDYVLSVTEGIHVNLEHSRGRHPKKISGKEFDRCYKLLKEKKITKKQMMTELNLSFPTLKKLIAEREASQS